MPYFICVNPRCRESFQQGPESAVVHHVNVAPHTQRSIGSIEWGRMIWWLCDYCSRYSRVRIDGPSGWYVLEHHDTGEISSIYSRTDESQLPPPIPFPFAPGKTPSFDQNSPRFSLRFGSEEAPAGQPAGLPALPGNFQRLSPIMPLRPHSPLSLPSMPRRAAAPRGVKALSMEDKSSILEKEMKTCAICLKVVILPGMAMTECNHVFHSQCLSNWQNANQNANNNTCPVCRKTLFSPDTR